MSFPTDTNIVSARLRYLDLCEFAENAVNIPSVNSGVRTMAECGYVTPSKYVCVIRVISAQLPTNAAMYSIVSQA